MGMSVTDFTTVRHIAPLGAQLWIQITGWTVVLSIQITGCKYSSLLVKCGSNPSPFPSPLPLEYRKYFLDANNWLEVKAKRVVRWRIQLGCNANRGFDRGVTPNTYLSFSSNHNDARTSWWWSSNFNLKAVVWMIFFTLVCLAMWQTQNALTLMTPNAHLWSLNAHLGSLNRHIYVNKKCKMIDYQSKELSWINIWKDMCRKNRFYNVI